MTWLSELVGSEEVSSIELLKWFRDNSGGVACTGCGADLEKVVWYLDYRDGGDIKVKDRGNVGVFVVCCSCGKEIPLKELFCN
ncbi:hypothetical protein [Geoglobus acetivorans]|uniref:Uncharacterized protein n=1 Tax=Geoglobus acetivorans TaxID=565033 RepID=A0A0A7GEE0_GEOAI|nr:hypothetical protein GACE_0239 [Geoglobus acetivorans]